MYILLLKMNPKVVLTAGKILKKLSHYVIKHPEVTKRTGKVIAKTINTTSRVVFYSAKKVIQRIYK